MQTISFVCACEMGVHLRNSAFIREHIRKIKFHWCGREADKGIVELENCSIESLTVVISQTTMKEPSRREAELSNHFTRFSNKRGFPEALGFEELSALRGLQEIDVELASKRRTKDGCSSTERSSLKAWLERLKQPSKG